MIKSDEKQTKRIAHKAADDDSKPKKQPSFDTLRSNKSQDSIQRPSKLLILMRDRVTLNGASYSDNCVSIYYKGTNRKIVNTRQLYLPKCFGKLETGVPTNTRLLDY